MRIQYIEDTRTNRVKSLGMFSEEDFLDERLLTSLKRALISTNVTMTLTIGKELHTFTWGETVNDNGSLY